MENLFNELGKYFTPQQQTGEQNSQYNNTMKKLITKNEAAKLTAGSEERKQELIELANFEISSQAQKGLRWAHLPSIINNFEQEWLKEELVLKGFIIKDGDPVINW